MGDRPERPVTDWDWRYCGGGKVVRLSDADEYAIGYAEYTNHLEAENKWLRGLLTQLRSKVRPKGSGSLSFDLKPHLIQDRVEVLLHDIGAALTEGGL